MTHWPRTRHELTDVQVATLEDWYSEFLTNTLPAQYGWIDRFNHSYAAKTAYAQARTLEIGPGNGSHLEFEDVSSQEVYVALELRESFSEEIRTRYPNVIVSVGDCEEGLDFPDNSFDRVLAIHVLEHLANLPAALAEVARILKPTGVFSVVIPCEGGAIYALGRRLTVQRAFEKRYAMSYKWVVEHEHVNNAREVISEVQKLFVPEDSTFFPLRIPLVDANVIVGLTLKLRNPHYTEGREQPGSNDER